MSAGEARPASLTCGVRGAASVTQQACGPCRRVRAQAKRKGRPPSHPATRDREAGPGNAGTAANAARVNGELGGWLGATVQDVPKLNPMMRH